MTSSGKRHLEPLLEQADIRINGDRPWDVQVHDDRVWGRVMTQGTLGLGEAYMDGWWDSDAIDETVHRLLVADIKDKIPLDLGLAVSLLRGMFTNFQRSRAFEVGEKHYDIGNDLYEAMLDKRLTYSCGYWRNASTLDGAQEAKLDLICRKLGLDANTHVLDIGSGWGSFLNFAHDKYGIQGTGVSVSREQIDYSRKISQGKPLDFKLQDYNDLTGQFDAITSIGMFEHVGYKNYRNFMEKTRKLLKPDGLMMLHTIGGNNTVTHGDPWAEKYIFPNGMLPSVKRIGEAIEDLYIMEDWHNFSADYDRTLMAWHMNFEAAWPYLKEKYDDRFYRMWRYYLLMFAGTFRARKVQLWQIVLSPEGVPDGYVSIR